MYKTKIQIESEAKKSFEDYQEWYENGLVSAWELEEKRQKYASAYLDRMGE